MRMIEFEKARKSVLDILAGKVNTVTAVRVAVTLEEAAVDAEPVRRAFWEDEETTILRSFQYGVAKWTKKKYFRCSSCYNGSVIRSRFCPKCGAKMDGGADNG